MHDNGIFIEVHFLIFNKTILLKYQLGTGSIQKFGLYLVNQQSILYMI